MEEIQYAQVCPYCDYEVEDHQSVWTQGEEEEVVCSNCERVYISKPQYTFEGWRIEKKCEKCGDFTDDGCKTCDCDEYSESY